MVNRIYDLLTNYFRIVLNTKMHLLAMNEINFKDFTIQYNDPHDISAIIETFIFDVYESKKIDKGDIVIDLGAGIGEFAVMASRSVGPEGKVIAIKPSPDDFKTLLINLRENKCDNVLPINSAVSDKPGILDLSFKSKNFKSNADSLIHLLNDRGVNLSSIKFIKMDIEGAERYVIPESLEIINKIDFLAMEIHGGYQKELIPLMNSLGFSFRRIDRRKYLSRAIKSGLLHPLQTTRIYSKFKRTGESPKMGKILNGIEISDSDNLVVGMFSKNTTNKA